MYCPLCKKELPATKTLVGTWYHKCPDCDPCAYMSPAGSGATSTTTVITQDYWTKFYHITNARRL